MEHKHTTGPWAHRNGRIFAADRENLTIAHVARAADGDYSPANGDVLAAAPYSHQRLHDRNLSSSRVQARPAWLAGTFWKQGQA